MLHNFFPKITPFI